MRDNLKGSRTMRRLMALAASLTLAAACADISGGGGGRTQVLLTDSPFPYNSIQAVNVYVVRIDVSTSSDTSIIAGPELATWTTVATPERACTRLDLQHGASAVRGESDREAAR